MWPFFCRVSCALAIPYGMHIIAEHADWFSHVLGRRGLLSAAIGPPKHAMQRILLLIGLVSVDV